MADAYAQVTGEIGICSVHQGPGLTNTMTGLTEAAKSRTPLVVLAGDDPGKVLGDLARLLAALPLPVQVGWGLPAGSFPWLARNRGTLDGAGLGA